MFRRSAFSNFRCWNALDSLERIWQKLVVILQSYSKVVNNANFSNFSQVGQAVAGNPDPLDDGGLRRGGVRRLRPRGRPGRDRARRRLSLV